MNPLRQTYRFFAPDHVRLLGVAGLLLAGTLLAVLKPWPVALAVDSLLGDRPLPAWFPETLRQAKPAMLLMTLAGATFVIHAAVALILAAGNRIAIDVGLNGLRRVRGEVFDRLQSLPLDFHLRHAQGDLIQRAAWDTYAVQTLFQQGFVTAGTAVLSLALMILVIARLNGPLTIVSLATMPLLLLAIRIAGPRMMAGSAAAQEQDGRLASHVQQNIAGVTVIRAFNREAAEAGQFGKDADESRRRRSHQHSLEVRYLAVVGIVFGGGVAAILLTGASQVMMGRATTGELIVFLAYLAQFYEPLNQLSNVGASLSAAGAGVARVTELLEAPLADEPATDPPAPVGDLQFDAVSFAFEPDKPVLNHLSFRIAAGERVALVGPSGAGKSTLLRLVQRFHEPSSGTIRAGDRSLAEWSRTGWRRHVTAIQQEPTLLPGTIADNIALGSPEASPEAITDAARATRAAGFISSCERGYETVVGEGAARLSVGECQRVNLARAFLKPAPFLLLDEPTSALDGDTEAAVAESLGRLAEGRTTIVVSHRPEVLKLAQRVIVMEAGRVTADGPPDEVARSNEFFDRLRNGRGLSTAP